MVRPRNESLDLIASKGLYNKGGDRAEELPDDYDDLIGSTLRILAYKRSRGLCKGYKKIRVHPNHCISYNQGLKASLYLANGKNIHPFPSATLLRSILKSKNYGTFIRMLFL